MSINRSFVYLFFLFFSIFQLSLQTSGFDLYHHIYTSSSLNAISINKNHFVIFFELPRYVLLNYLFWIFQAIYIPHVLLLSVIYMFMWVSIFDYVTLKRNFNALFFLFWFLYVTTMYSSINFSASLLVSSLVNKKLKHYIFYVLSISMNPIFLFIAPFIMFLFYGRFAYLYMFIFIFTTAILLVNDLSYLVGL